MRGVGKLLKKKQNMRNGLYQVKLDILFISTNAVEI